MASTPLEERIAVLARTPRVLDGLLRDLPTAWLHSREGEGTWSPHEVLGHLLHGEVDDWIPRARIILEQGERRPFDPFDRFAQQRLYGDLGGNELLERFADARAGNLATLRGLSLSAADLERRGVHPALGPVTLDELLSTWVVHDLGHIAQMTRAMARREDAAVGPWREYLPVLTRR